MSCKHTPSALFGTSIFSPKVTCRNCEKQIEPTHPLIARGLCLCAWIVLFHLYLANRYFRFKEMWGAYAITLVACGLTIAYIFYFAAKHTKWQLTREIKAAHKQPSCRHRPSNPAIIQYLNLNQPAVNTEPQPCIKCGYGIRPKNRLRLKIIAAFSIIIQWFLIADIIDYFRAFAIGIYSFSPIEGDIGLQAQFLQRFIISDTIEILILFATAFLGGYLSTWELSCTHKHSSE